MKQRKPIGIASVLLSLSCLLNWNPAPSAQTSKMADWLTDGGDVERTAWQRNETILSTTSVKNMKLLWKTKLDNEPRQMHSLLPALIASNVKTTSGLKQIVLVTGVSDNLYALDAETGEQLDCNEEVNFASAGVWGSLATWEDSKGTRWILVEHTGALPASFTSADGAVTRSVCGCVYESLLSPGQDRAREPAELWQFRPGGQADAPLAHARGPVPRCGFPLHRSENRSKGAILAYKVGVNGKLVPGWASRNLVSPLPPTVINGVVIATASGGYRTNDNKMTAAMHAARSGRAVIYLKLVRNSAGSRPRLRRSQMFIELCGDGAQAPEEWPVSDVASSKLSTGRAAGAKTIENIGRELRTGFIYLLDGATGKELWNSGTTITSFARGNALSGGMDSFI